MGKIRGVEKAFAFMAVFLALALSAYSLSVEVDYPEGGENISDQYMDINWTTSGTCSEYYGVDIYYDYDNDPSHGSVLLAQQEPNDGYYNLSLIGFPIGSNYIRIRAVCNNPPDIANNYSERRFTKTGFNLTYTSNGWTAESNINTAPNVTVISPSSGTTARGIYNISFNASDPENDSVFATIYISSSPGAGNSTIIYGLPLSGTEYCNDSDNNFSTSNHCWYEWDSAGIDGSYYIDIEVTDGQLNATGSSDQFTADNTPHLSVDYPNGGENISSRYASINWTADDISGFNISYVDIYYDSDNEKGTGRTLIASNITDGENYTWDTQAVQFGMYYISIDAKSTGFDSSGNYIELNITDYSDAPFSKVGAPLEYTSNNITFEVQAGSIPSVYVVEPNGGESYSSSTSIRLNFSDNDSDLVSADIYYSSSPGAFENLLFENIDLADRQYCSDPDFNTSTENNCTIYWNSTGLNADYYIDIIVNDTVYTSNDSSDSFFTVDNQPIMSNLSVSNITSSSVVIRWDVNEPANATIRYGETLEYGYNFTNSTLTEDHSHFITGIPGNKFYYFIAISCDSTGNCINQTGNFTMLNTHPFVNVTYPNGGEQINSSVINITWEGYDSDGDNVTFSVYYDTDDDTTSGRSLIASNLSGDTNTTQWDIQIIDEGYYYISVDVFSYDLESDSIINSTDYSDSAFLKVASELYYESNEINLLVEKNNRPYAEVVEPNGGEEYSLSTVIRINFSDNDSDLVSADIYYSSSPGAFENLLFENIDFADRQYCSDPDFNTSTENNCTFYWNTTGINEDYYIDIRLNDTVYTGNDSSDSFFTVDNQPEISNITISNITSSSALVSWESTEPVNATVFYSTDQSNLSSMEINSTYNINISVHLSGLAGNRRYFLIAQSCDSSENCINSSLLNFTTLNRQTQLNVTYPNGGEQIDGIYTLINWTASDDDSDNISINLYYDNDNDKDNGRTLIAENISNTGTYNWSLSSVPIRDLFISIDAITTLAENSTEESVTDYSDAPFSKVGAPLEYTSNNLPVIVNINTPPFINITVPAGGEIYNISLPIKFNVSDEEADPLFGVALKLYEGDIYRRQLNYSNTLSQRLDSYPVNFSIDTASLYEQGKMRADGRKMTITVGGVDVPYYNTTPFNTNNTVIWFNLDIGQSQIRDDIYVYYGADSPIAQSQNASISWENLRDAGNILEGQAVSSILEDSSYPASNSNDGSFTSLWRSQLTSPGVNTTTIDWLKYTLDDVYEPYMAYFRLTDEGAENVTLFRSDDGSNYTQISNYTFSSSQSYEADYFEPETLRYFYVDVSSIITYAEFYEVELHEPVLLELAMGDEEFIGEYEEELLIDLSDASICNDPDLTTETENNCSYNWNTSRHDGNFYVCLTITDMINRTTDCSGGKIIINNLGDEPSLLSPIPNQTWTKNTNITINLSQYFYDPDGDDLGFESSGTSNITITIDNSTDIAVLSPAEGWIGTEYTVFTAYDASGYNASSNNVTLTVQSDAPVINYSEAYPSQQGFGENVTITAVVTDSEGQSDIYAVWAGITPPGENQTNYTMQNISLTTWTLDYTGFSNGTYAYSIYANDSLGAYASISNGTFEMFVRAYSAIRTLKDIYDENEIVYITGTG